MAFPTGYSQYQEVTIDSTYVHANETDFVVYIPLSKLVKAGDDLFDTCRSDGGDIRVTKSDGTTQLCREVYKFNYSSKKGGLYVKFTGTLSSTGDTVVRVWYNGVDTEPSASSTYGRNNTWSGARWVLHTGANSFLEASGSYTFTSGGGARTSSSDTPLDYNSTHHQDYNDRYYTAGSSMPTGDHSILALKKIGTTGNYTFSNGNSGFSTFYYIHYNTDEFRVFWYRDSETSSITLITTNGGSNSANWQLIGFKADFPGTQVWKAYDNKNEVTFPSHTNASSHRYTSTEASFYPDSDEIYTIETRLYVGAKTHNWYKTNYENLLNVDNFIKSTGDEQVEVTALPAFGSGTGDGFAAGASAFGL